MANLLARKEDEKKRESHKQAAHKVNAKYPVTFLCIHFLQFESLRITLVCIFVTIVA